MENLERLRFYIEKRIQTTMIGAISKFENNFGYLWGHHLTDEDSLSPQQLDFSDLWETTRNEILNQGNNQIRQIKEDFYRYGGGFKQNYSYNFKPPKDQDTK